MRKLIKKIEYSRIPISFHLYLESNPNCVVLKQSFIHKKLSENCFKVLKKSETYRCRLPRKELKWVLFKIYRDRFSLKFLGRWLRSDQVELVVVVSLRKHGIVPMDHSTTDNWKWPTCFLLKVWRNIWNHPYFSEMEKKCMNVILPKVK